MTVVVVVVVDRRDARGRIASRGCRCRARRRPWQGHRRRVPSLSSPPGHADQGPCIRRRRRPPFCARPPWAASTSCRAHVRASTAATPSRLRQSAWAPATAGSSVGRIAGAPRFFWSRLCTAVACQEHRLSRGGGRERRNRMPAPSLLGCCCQPGSRGFQLGRRGAQPSDDALVQDALGAAIGAPHPFPPPPPSPTPAPHRAVGRRASERAAGRGPIHGTTLARARHRGVGLALLAAAPGRARAERLGRRPRRAKAPASPRSHWAAASPARGPRRPSFVDPDPAAKACARRGPSVRPR